MPAPLSNDLRKRIVESHNKGKTVKQIVEIYEVGQNTVYCLLRLVRETGDYKPRENKNGIKPFMNKEDLERLEALVLANPDLTLEEIKEKMESPLCISALCRIINNKLGLHRKKNSSPKPTKPRRCKTEEK